MLSNRSFSLRPVAPYHVGAFLFSVQTHPWLEDPISLLAVVIAIRPLLSGCRPMCSLPVRGDSFTGGGGTVSSCGTLRVNALTFHNQLIHRDGSISLQLETYKSLLCINSYRLASSLPNN